LRPDAAGSASERKALGKPTRRPPAFFAGAPFPVLASGQTTVVPFPLPLLSEEWEGKAQRLRHIHSPIRLCDSTLEKSEVERLRQRPA
jgi:hypothetical protein